MSSAGSVLVFGHRAAFQPSDADGPTGFLEDADVSPGFCTLWKSQRSREPPLEYLLSPVQSATPRRGYVQCLHSHDWWLFPSQDSLVHHFIKTALKFFSRLVEINTVNSSLVRSAINNCSPLDGPKVFTPAESRTLMRSYWCRKQMMGIFLEFGRINQCSLSSYGKE